MNKHSTCFQFSISLLIVWYAAWNLSYKQTPYLIFWRIKRSSSSNLRWKYRFHICLYHVFVFLIVLSFEKKNTENLCWFCKLYITKWRGMLGTWFCSLYILICKYLGNFKVEFAILCSLFLHPLLFAKYLDNCMYKYLCAQITPIH